jgi:glycerophosphoryl diester phosphodiesterase
MTRLHPYDRPTPFGIAHRGGASEFPENTLPAFEGAVRLGFDCVETDVHLTADGVLLAFHDDRLDRVTDRSGLIAEMPYSAVSEALVDGKEPIPLLSDLLGAFPDLVVNIDPKHDASVEPLVEVLRSARAFDRVCVGAFSDRRLQRFRALTGGAVATSLGPRGVARLLAASRGAPGGKFVEVAAQVPVMVKGRRLVTQRFVETAHRRGLQVHVWTVDEPAEMHELLDLGVDALITDRPATLRSVLESRGVW